MIAPARISCSEPQIFAAFRIGHHVWIDDGKIGAVVEALDERGAWLRVTHARPGGERIGADKGLNFPDGDIPLPAISRWKSATIGWRKSRRKFFGYAKQRMCR